MDNFGIVAVLTLNLCVAAALLVIFSILNILAWTIPVYQPRTDPDNKASVMAVESGAPRFPVMLTRVLQWPLAGFRVTDEEILARSGVESLMYLRFQRNVIELMIFFLFWSIIMIGVNSTGTDVHDSDPAHYHPSIRNWSTQNIRGGDRLLWLHCVVFVLYTGAFYARFRKLALSFDEVRRTYLRANNRIKLDPRDLSLMIRGLPRSLREATLLKTHIQTHLYPDTVISAWLVYDSPSVWHLHAKKKENEEKYVHYINLWEKLQIEAASKGSEAERPKYTHRTFCNPLGEKVDAISYFKDQMDALTVLMEEELNRDDHPTSGSAFVTFKDPITVKKMYQNFDCKYGTTLIEGFEQPVYTRKSAMGYAEKALDLDTVGKALAKQGTKAATRAARRGVGHHAPSKSKMDEVKPQKRLAATEWEVLPAPDPEEIVWKNFYIGKRSVWLREIATTVATWFLIVIAGAAIGSISNWDTLANFITLRISHAWGTKFADALKRWGDSGYKSWLDFLNSYIPTLVLLVITTLLPILFKKFGQIRGYLTDSHIQSYILKSYYAFVLAAFVIGPNVLNGVLSALGRPISSGQAWELVQSLLESITAPISGVPFALLIQYSLISNCVAFLRIGPFLGRIVKRKFAVTKDEFEKADEIAPISFHLEYPAMLLCLSIPLIYAITAPLFIPFGLLYFLMKHWLDRYLIAYVYPTPVVDSRGLYFASAIKIMLIIQGIFQIATCVMFFGKSTSRSGDTTLSPQFIVCLVMVLINIGTYSYVNKQLDKIFKSDYWIPDLEEQQTDEEKRQSMRKLRQQQREAAAKQGEGMPTGARRGGAEKDSVLRSGADATKAGEQTGLLVNDSPNNEAANRGAGTLPEKRPSRLQVQSNNNLIALDKEAEDKNAPPHSGKSEKAPEDHRIGIQNPPVEPGSNLPLGRGEASEYEHGRRSSDAQGSNAAQGPRSDEDEHEETTGILKAVIDEDQAYSKELDPMFDEAKRLYLHPAFQDILNHRSNVGEEAEGEKVGDLVLPTPHHYEHEKMRSRILRRQDEESRENVRSFITLGDKGGKVVPT